MSDTTEDNDPAVALKAGETVLLERVDPAQNAFRAYTVAIWPDLFDEAVLVRSWGRIGATTGRVTGEPYMDTDAAAAAGAALIRQKEKRGYVTRDG